MLSSQISPGGSFTSDGLSYLLCTQARYSREAAHVLRLLRAPADKETGQQQLPSLCRSGNIVSDSNRRENIQVHGNVTTATYLIACLTGMSNVCALTVPQGGKREGEK